MMYLKIIYLVFVGLVFLGMSICMFRIRKTKTTFSKILLSILAVAMAVMLSNMAFFIFHKRVYAGLIHLALYYSFLDWLVLGFLMYSQEYTGRYTFGKPFFVTMGAFCLADFVNLMLNVKFHHMFDIIKVSLPAVGIFYQQINFTWVHYLHIVFVYALAFVAIVQMIVKSLRSPRFYRVKYITIFTFYIFVIAVNALCVFLNFPVDVSAFLFVLLALTTAYFSIFFVSARILGKTLGVVAKDFSQAIACFDAESNCIFINDFGKKIFNLDLNEPDLKKMSEYYKIWQVRNNPEHKSSLDWRDVQMIDNKQRFFDAGYREIRDEETKALITSYFIVSDKTDSINQLRKERELADHDHLTKVYNRQKFIQTAHQILEAQKNVEYILLCTNVNDFKLINELFGSHYGDEILIEEANLLKRYAKSGSILGRVSGDKFALCLPKKSFDEEVFLEALEMMTHRLDKGGLKIRISVGVYAIPVKIEENAEDNNNPKDEKDAIKYITDSIDKALFACQSVTRNYNKIIAYYDSTMMEESLKKLEVVSGFDKALSLGQFRMFLQPQISSVTGKLTGAEALVRWQSPSKGLLKPAEFIPVLESSNLIFKLDSYMWEQACKQLKDWEKKGITDIPISVNISARDLFCMDIYACLTKLVEEYYVDPKKLNLEITESAFMTNRDYSMSVIKKLKEYGFLIEMDDFGSGYSSLNMFKDMNADVVKLDMLFLSDTDNMEKSERIIKTVINLSKELNMRVIVEGVEKLEQTKFLVNAGADAFQGFYFDKPLSLDDFEKKYIF